MKTVTQVEIMFKDEEIKVLFIQGKTLSTGGCITQTGDLNEAHCY